MLQRIESTGIMATFRKQSRSLWTNLVTLYILLLMSGEASVAAAKIDVFAKNGYNKCNKFRTIMKIIT